MLLYTKILFNLFLIICLNQLLPVHTHGRLMNPPARGSRWRFNVSAPIDYNDNEGFCGGYFKQWEIHNGECGLCGNDYEDEIPRAHELGGVYGEGTIVKTYNLESEIIVGVYITANHKGHFLFDLCNLDSDFENEKCFQKEPLQLINGDYEYSLESIETGWFNTTIKIPSGLTCNHCVFRWTYITGNNWGLCSNGSEAIGCGPQENFKGCSDISIK